ncbi:MAG TPA: phosphoadenylyl-sulfate reductase [Candidatus Dormibacteraeota bacterium]|nr:phosphoadenylyl-sulfate reductase [Candidatus Dormibacteraeota bacterium]
MRSPRVAVGPHELEETRRGLEGCHPRAAIRWALTRFAPERTAVVTSLQADGMAVVEMALRIDPRVRIVTIDTGRLPEETYAYLDEVRAHFGRGIEVLLPDATAVGGHVSEHGVTAFRASVERRLDCCHLRKVEPLERLLATLDCWLTGLRRDHSARRGSTPVVQLDTAHGGIVKVNPVAGWDETAVRAHLAASGVPLHPLYAHGYRSIGCAPCTRPVAPGDDPRSGRWWWEQGVDKECGIHATPALLQERRSA